MTSTLNEEITTVQGMFIELFLTAQLMLAVLIAATDKKRPDNAAPIYIGLSLFIGVIAGTLPLHSRHSIETD